MVPKQQTSQEAQLKYIELDNVQLFLQTAYEYNYMYYIYFKVLIETGMRKDEAAALQWPDIDLKEGKITFTKSLDFQADSEDELFGDTKTFNSPRTIVISSSLSNELKEHMNGKTKISS